MGYYLYFPFFNSLSMVVIKSKVFSYIFCGVKSLLGANRTYSQRLSTSKKIFYISSGEFSFFQFFFSSIKDSCANGILNYRFIYPHGLDISVKFLFIISCQQFFGSLQTFTSRFRCFIFDGYAITTFLFVFQ